MTGSAIILLRKINVMMNIITTLADLYFLNFLFQTLFLLE